MEQGPKYEFTLAFLYNYIILYLKKKASHSLKRLGLVVNL